VTRLDNDGADYCHLVCGYFGCDARPFNPLLEALPRMLLSQMPATAQSWLSKMLRVAAEEAGRGEAGSESLLAKLAELMLSKSCASTSFIFPRIRGAGCPD